MPRTRNTAVVASPGAAAETVVASIVGLNIPIGDAVDIEATCDITIGTAGTTVQLRLRETQLTTGLLVASYGPFTVTAANRYNFTINGVDNLAVEQDNMAYSLTVQVANATAASTVNGVYIGAIY